MPHTTHLAQEIATQPDDWARVVARLDEVRAAPARARASGSRRSGAARRGSWPRRMPRRREEAGQGDTDAYRRLRAPARTAATTASC